MNARESQETEQQKRERGDMERETLRYNRASRRERTFRIGPMNFAGELFQRYLSSVESFGWRRRGRWLKEYMDARPSSYPTFEKATEEQQQWLEKTAELRR